MASPSPVLQRSIGSDPDALLEVLAPALGSVITDEIRGDVEREKIFQYSQARKHELYWRGDQYLVPQFAEGGLIVDYSPVSGNIKYNDSDAQASLYDYVVNDFRGYGRKFVAVLQQPPNCKAVPNRSDDEDHERRARKADSINQQISSLWDNEAITQQLALSIYKDGTTFLYTPFVANPDKWGYTQEPVYEDRAVEVAPGKLRCVNCGAETPVSATVPPPASCPNCGNPFGPEDYIEPETMTLPEQVGVKKYANGFVECHVCNIFTVTTPFYSKDLSDVPYLMYEYEEHKGSLFRAFPSLTQLKNLEGSAGYHADSAAGAYGKMARDTASTPTGAYIVPRKNRLLYSRIWLRPSMYPLCKQKVSLGGSQEVEVGDILNEYYPDGARVTSVQDNVVGIRKERLDRLWAMAKSDLSEYIFSDPYCKDFVTCQDETNDMHNIAIQTWERSSPMTAVDASKIDIKQLAQRRTLPAEFLPFTSGTDLSKVMQQLPVAKPEPEMIKWIEGHREHSAENMGVTRAIFGASLPNETAHQAELNKQQGMMQLNLVWTQMRNAIAKARQNGILQLAEHSNGRIPDPFGTGSITEVDDIEDLMEGGWHMEAAPDMPMTWGERRAWLMQMLNGKGVDVVGLLGFNSPENVDSIQDIMALQGWKVPSLDAKAKVMDTIRKLLKGKPMPGPDGTMQPSIPIDIAEDDHHFSNQMAWLWAQTDAARALRDPESRTYNPDGYANVIAWGSAHGKAAAPPAGPPPPDPLRDSLNVSVKFETLAPELQVAILQKANLITGPPPAPAPHPVPAVHAPMAHATGPEPTKPNGAPGLPPLVPAGVSPAAPHMPTA